MKIFSKLYAWMMKCSRHRHAPYYLYTLSFAESSVFPIPPDVMLAPMALAKPECAWNYATMTTLASVFGGLFGYLIGMFCFELIQPYILKFGYEPTYQKAVLWFSLWGFWVIFIAGFTPIPYKIFTIAAGVIGMSLPVFIVASIIGRGGRFFLVTAFMRWGGARMEKLLHSYVDRIGWSVLGIILIAAVAMQLTGCSTQGEAAPVSPAVGEAPANGVYRIKPNETLYSISWRYGLDYRKLAEINNITPPYKVRAGQTIKLRANAVTTSISETKSVATPKEIKEIKEAILSPSSTPEVEPKSLSALPAAGQWLWPAKGKMVATFTSGRTINKGIDIVAARGAPVIATASGKVVYSGNGLKGYGELIIIKHSDEFLSAYAHNRKLLVREGAFVRAGQTIALVGDTDAKQPMLHFEIRKAGKPVDPLKYLPKRDK